MSGQYQLNAPTCVLLSHVPVHACMPSCRCLGCIAGFKFMYVISPFSQTENARLRLQLQSSIRRARSVSAPTRVVASRRNAHLSALQHVPHTVIDDALLQPSSSGALPHPRPCVIQDYWGHAWIASLVYGVFITLICVASRRRSRARHQHHHHIRHRLHRAVDPTQRGCQWAEHGHVARAAG